jgi:hypothetical protein
MHGAWILSELCSLKTMQIIQQIPISRHGGEDFASWPHAQLGLHTVRATQDLNPSTHPGVRAGKGSNSDEVAQSKEGQFNVLVK